MITSRHLKLVLLAALMGATFFLASFNATIRFIVNQQRMMTSSSTMTSSTDDTTSSSASSGSQIMVDDSDEEENNNDAAIDNIEKGGQQNPKNGGVRDGEEAKNNVSQQQQQQKRTRRNNIKTTTRPLDGFAQDAFFVDPVTKTKKKYLQRRPPTVAANSAFHENNNINNNNNKKLSAADAHYAKAMRMLSSPFDQLKDGGNAFPHPLYGGEYDQGGVGYGGSAAGRGEKFVKMEDYYNRYHSGKPGEKIDPGTKLVKQKYKTRQRLKQLQRRRMQRQRRRRRRRQREDGTAAATTTTTKTKTTTTVNDGNDDDDDELAIVLEEIKHILLDLYESILDWMHDTFGFVTNIETPDTEDNDDDDENDTDEEYYYHYYSHHSQDHHQRHHHGVGDDVADDQFLLSWRDTTVGKQLRWTYSKVASLWYRQRRQVNKINATTATTNFDYTTADGKSLSRQDQMAWEGLFHLEKAAELGHAEAQRMVANSLASGILPISDHSLMRRVAEWKYHNSRRQFALDDQNSSTSNDDDGGVEKMMTNWTSILLQSTLQVPDDYSSAGAGAVGGEQLSRAIILWHLSAMSGNVESAMALGYRHLYSATGGLTQTFMSKPLQHQSHVVDDDATIAVGFHPLHGGVIGGQQSRADGVVDITNAGGAAGSHYGVLGTCHSALAYYEAAAHGIMDELESGPTKGKVNPPMDEHRLLEMFNTGGASSALARHNKYDESEEALQYYHFLAIGSRSHDPDVYAAHTLASLYYHGIRGVKQDLRLALKYLEICAEYNHTECGGQAGLMHVWGIGMTPEERDLGKAYNYFFQGTTGKLDYCVEQLRKRRKQISNKSGSEGEIELCDRYSINGMGLLNLFGVNGVIERDVNMARRWFEHGKDVEDPDSMYNYAMLHLGWMVSELDDLQKNTTVMNSIDDEHGVSGRRSSVSEQNYMTHRKAPAESDNVDKYTGPSVSDYNIALQQLKSAAKNGHLQAKHKLGVLYASGVTVPRKNGRPTQVVQQSCPSALRYFKSVADNGHIYFRRNLAAWKQYIAGDYESSLRNYLASAETGSEVGQVNAAFLLEQGYCLGMTPTACTHASIRLWRAAARQGNLEACLRVGDFYYYGRMVKSRGETAMVHDGEEFLTSLTPKAFYFVPGPYRWARYALYPEELCHLISKRLLRSLHNLWQLMSALLGGPGGDPKVGVHTSQNVCFDETEKSCLPDGIDSKAEEYDHMVIAAQYYRKAAVEFKSARGHFNLGFMHEWGLGLAQDFPLAKRHYDLAKENNSNWAAAVALYAMSVHQMAVKAAIYLKNFGFGVN